MTTEHLIVTQSDVLQQGLSALMESLLELTDVAAVKDLESAYMWIEEYQPKIVLLDLALLGNGPFDPLEKIHLLSPGTKRLLLVDDVQDVRLAPQYAEAIVIKGDTQTTVATILAEVVSSQGDKK
jgi:DNA-binding NarL/FixJ family response regulator